jgi:ATP-binding cassette subfamily C protein
MEAQDLPTEVVTLRGNDTLPLDDPDVAWEVEAGTVAVFVAARGEDGAPGRRRHGFVVEPGGCLFGLPSSDDAGTPIVLAVAIDDVRLRRRSWKGGAAPGETAVRGWLARWEPIAGVADVVPAGAPRALAAWVERTLPGRLADWLAREESEERERFGRSRRSSADVVVGSVRDLAGILFPAASDLPDGTPLFVAASAVARARGIEVRRPAPTADDDDASVEAIARASGFRVREVLLHDRWWREDAGPLLGFRREDRAPLALLPVGRGRYEALDPTTRRREPIDAAAASAIDPGAFTFYRPFPDRAGERSELLRFALHGRGRDLGYVLAMAVLATLAGMVAPVATAVLIDHAIPDADLGTLGHLALALAAAAFGLTMFRWAQGIALVRFETAADADTQSAVWDRLLRLQLSFFRDYSSGDLESRVTAVSRIRSYLGGGALRTLFGGVALLLNFFLLLYWSAALTTVAVAVAVLSAAVTIASGVAILSYTRRILARQGNLSGLMVQLIQGAAKLRVAAAEERAFAAWARSYGALVDLELRRNRLVDAVAVANGLLSTLSTVALFAIASATFRDPATAPSVGVFLAFFAAYGAFLAAVTSVSETITDVLAIEILRERVQPILAARPEVDRRKASPGVLAGRVEMDRIAFRYGPDTPLVLDDVSLRCGAGEFVALVGPSGSGKSTILRLLLGFESPASGSIFFDGQELSGLDVHAVRRQMGVVLQTGRISAGSIYENVIGGARASLDDAWEAARAVGFAEEIEAMPMGMHTVVSEAGGNLSGGQRQRLLLARALVHRPRILLLDEATSALDNRTQAVVSGSLERLSITRIVIAHRLSTVRQADRIYVIEAGRVVESGTFDELAAAGGTFSRLMRRQQL